MHGKFVEIGPGSQTMDLYVKTAYGTATIKKTVTGTGKASTVTGNKTPLPIPPPGTIVIKGRAGPIAHISVNSLKAQTVSVNDRTTMLW